jgi:hypothetical protein
VLPELNCESSFDVDYGCDIVTSIASDRSSAFRVLMIGKDKYESQFNLHTFVSGEASWRAPAKCFNMMERQIWRIDNKEAVVCGGYAHWLFVSESNQFHVLNVDVQTGRLSLTKLLSPTKDWIIKVTSMETYEAEQAHNHRVVDGLSHGNRLLTTANGTRLSLCAYRDRRLEIWTQKHQDDGCKSGDRDEEWKLTREIDHRLSELIQQLERPTCIWWGERSGTMLITERFPRGSCLHIAHLDAGTLEEATDQFAGHVPNGVIMPMEIDDWPTFFMMRLGGS